MGSVVVCESGSLPVPCSFLLRRLLQLPVCKQSSVSLPRSAEDADGLDELSDYQGLPPRGRYLISNVEARRRPPRASNAALPCFADEGRRGCGWKAETGVNPECGLLDTGSVDWEPVIVARDDLLLRHCFKNWGDGV